jgi:hypothetical protein
MYRTIYDENEKYIATIDTVEPLQKGDKLKLNIVPEEKKEYYPPIKKTGDFEVIKRHFIEDDDDYDLGAVHYECIYIVVAA